MALHCFPQRQGFVCKAGESREKFGRCISNLVLAPAATAEASAKVLPGQVARSKLLYTAVRALPSEEQQPKEQQSGRKSIDALNEKGFAEGDMAVLSIDGELLLTKWHQDHKHCNFFHGSQMLIA